LPVKDLQKEKMRKKHSTLRLDCFKWIKSIYILQSLQNYLNRTATCSFWIVLLREAFLNGIVAGGFWIEMLLVFLINKSYLKQSTTCLSLKRRTCLLARATAASWSPLAARSIGSRQRMFAGSRSCQSFFPLLE